MIEKLRQHQKLRQAIQLALLTPMLYCTIAVGCYGRGSTDMPIKGALLGITVGFLIIFSLVTLRVWKTDQNRTPLPRRTAIAGLIIALLIYAPIAPALYCMAHTGSEMAHAACITAYAMAASLLCALLFTRLRQRKQAAV